MPTPHPNSESEEKLREKLAHGVDILAADHIKPKTKQVWLDEAISLIRSYAAEQVREARIDEIESLDQYYWGAPGDDDLDTFIDQIIQPYVNDRLAQLTTPEQEEGTANYLARTSKPAPTEITDAISKHFWDDTRPSSEQEETLTSQQALNEVGDYLDKTTTELKDIRQEGE